MKVLIFKSCLSKKMSKYLILQVFQDCGQPRLGKRQSGGFGYGQQSSSGDRPAKPTTAAGTNLDILVNEISKVKDTTNKQGEKNYFLPQFCNI